MKLQHKINIRFLAITILVFSIAGFLFYSILGRVVHQNIDEMLQSRKEILIRYLTNHQLQDSVYQSPDNAFVIQQYQGQNLFQYNDTLIYTKTDKEIIPFRKLSFSITTNGKTYKIVLVQSLLESDDLIEVVFYFMLALFVILFVVLFALNYSLSFSIWKPFYNMLNTLKAFKIGKTQETHFPKTGTFEFDILNETLNGLTQKLQTDFINLKEFTENASHEIQTPLAIIKSKLEMSLHDPLLPENHRNYIHSAYESAIRLSKLNEALLLLSKIENRQFVEETNIDLTLLVKEKLNQIEELVELKNIKVSLDLNSSFEIKMNPYLAEILINNLLGNALKHNIRNGEIRITAERHLLTFSNTGKPLTIEPEKLFKRFVKQSASSESTGLGLAIAFEISSIYHLSLQYKYQNGYHTLSLFGNL